jgi:hypothetical protein
MSPTGRRFAAAAAAGLIGLAGLALLALPGRVASAAQEKTVDLRSVESAAEYRTDEPEGPGFLGSDAAVLDRSLARINEALGTDLRPDNRLGRLARWVYEQLGQDYAMPSQAAMDVLTHRLGLPEPLPHLLVTQAPDAPRAANVVSSRLARLFDITDYTHIGGVAERQAGGIVVVIAVSRRRLTMAPVPRRLDGPWTIKLEGRLSGEFRKPELAHTLPDGRTKMEPLGEGTSFSRTVALSERGRHRLEILAEGPDGPNVLANFPVFVGVPVDESAAAGPPRGKAVRAVEVQDILLELINADRVEAGLEPLAPDLELAELALRHSEDMRENDFVAHVSPTAGTTDERLARAGIVTDLAAENVGKGYGAEEIHRGFMESPGHRGAVLLAGATHVGIGVASKKEGDLTTYFATEVFIRRIPPLRSDAATVFHMELDGLRESAGLGRLEEDFILTEIAETAARGYLLDASLTRDDVMDRLAERIEETYKRRTTMQVVFTVVGSLEDGAKQAAADPRTDKARRIGIGLAQGTRPGHAPNSIVLVLIYAD